MIETSCSRTIIIPGLVDVISSCLSRADLPACVQVNNQWHQTFTSKLWHTIDDTQASWERVLQECQNKDPTLPTLMTTEKELLLRGAFAKYGHFIRRLRVRCPLFVEIAGTSGICTQLADLEINLRDSMTGDVPFQGNTINILNDAMSNLSVVRLLDSGNGDGDELLVGFDWAQPPTELPPPLSVYERLGDCQYEESKHVLV